MAKREDQTPLERVLSFVAVMQSLRSVGGGSESSIATTERIDLEGRARLPVAQSINIVYGGLMALAGLGAIGYGAWRGFDLFARFPAPAFLVMWFASWGFLSLPLDLVRARLGIAPLRWHGLTLLGWTLVTVSALATVGATWWLALSAAGVVVMAAGAFLAWHQAYELLSRYRHRSPLEEAYINTLLPAVAEMLMPTERAAPIQTRRAYPLVQGHRFSGYEAIETDPGTWQPDPAQHNLVFFALFAAGTRSLSRRAILYNPAVKGSVTLPGVEGNEPETLGREQYDRLVRHGEKQGWWRRRGEKRSPELLMTWNEIAADAAALWHEIAPGLDLPDFWSGQSYTIGPVVEEAA